MANKPKVCPYITVMQHAYDTDAKKGAEGHFKWLVTVNHHDLTTCVFHNAEVEKYEGWLIVYTEHNGFHIFLDSIEDLKWRRWKMR